MDDSVPHSDQTLDILFVTSDLYPPFRPAAKAVFAEGLAARGHRIDWLMQAAEPSNRGGAQAFKGGTAYVAPTNAGTGRLARLRRHLAAVRNDFKVFALLRRHRYSLVQIKDKYFGALVAIVAAKLYRVPVFYWLAYPHGEASLYAARNRVARYRWIYRLRGALQRFVLYRIIIPSCKHVFVQSEQMRRDVACEGVPLESMTAVPSSLNLRDLDAQVDGADDAPAGPPTVVYLGTLLRERQLDFIVRAHALVVAALPDAQLVFVGGGWMPDDEQLLRREADRFGVSPNVTITGWLPRSIGVVPVSCECARYSPGGTFASENEPSAVIFATSVPSEGMGLTPRRLTLPRAGSPPAVRTVPDTRTVRASITPKLASAS